MLTHIGHDYRLAFGFVRKHPHDFGHFDLLGIGREFGNRDGFLFLRVQFLEFGVPFLMAIRVEERREHFQGFLRVADHGGMGFHDFVHLGGVDLDVNDFRLLGVARHIARHAVVEPQPDADQHVAFVGEAVGTVIAVHPQPSRVQWMIHGNRRQAQQRRSAGNAGFLDQFEQFFLSPG